MNRDLKIFKKITGIQSPVVYEKLYSVTKWGILGMKGPVDSRKSLKIILSHQQANKEKQYCDINTHKKST